ncbi:MAG: trigger factor, partial [Candidatus Hydrogenedentota bacterium]
MADDKHDDQDIAQEEDLDTGDAPAAAEVAEEGDEETFKFVEDPEFDVKYQGDCLYEVDISIPPANRTKKSEELFSELKSEAEVPGFRPGRAPRRVLEKRFGKAVKGEVISQLLDAAFKKLLEEQELEPLDTPDIEGIKENEDTPDTEPLKFTLKFEVGPIAKIDDYKNLELEREVLKVGDDEVDAALERLGERNQDYVTVDDAAQEDDQVVIDFDGAVDGEFFEGGAGRDYPYILGAKRFFPEFDEVLTGAKAGDEKQCEVTLPGHMPNEALRGQKAQFTLKVKNVKRKQNPELNDEFAQNLGYENLSDMREKIRESIQERYDSVLDSRLREQAVDKLVDMASFELPQSWVTRLTEGYVNDLRSEAGYEQDETGSEEEEAEWRKHAQERAEREIK